MNILFVRNLFYPRDLGGSRYEVEVCRRLAARGHALTIVTSQPSVTDGEGPWQMVCYQVNRRWPVTTHLSNVLGAGRLLRDLMGRLRPDVIILGSYDVALAATWAGRGTRIPTLFIYHSRFDHPWLDQTQGPLRRLRGWAARVYVQAAEAWVFRRVERIIAVSGFSGDQVAARVPQAAERVTVIPTGVDLSEFLTPAPDQRPALRRRLGLPLDCPVLVTVGRLAAVKQLDVFLKSLTLLAGQGIRVCARVIGAGPEEHRLRALVQAWRLDPFVALTGYQGTPELRAYLQAADAVVFTSRFENCSLAMLEALACGTPVLAPAVGGIPELLSPVEPRFLFRANTPEAVAEAVASFLRALPTQEAMWRQRCRTVAEQRYSWDRVIDDLERLCERAIAR